MAKAIESRQKLQNFSDFGKTEHVQKVTSLESAASSKEEQQLNVWIPKGLMKRLKVKGAEVDKSLKEMVTEALEQFI